jgi:serine/threonine-protein kinase
MADILDRLKAALADRYQIERELGSGGMATVYLAEDLKHHRKVAVKVLRPELAAALGVDRFHREIEIAAGLTHPHILTLIDSGDADGFLFYVMPFVEGQSLRDKLAHEGELPIGEAVRILRDVVDALTHAHKHNVVHRDIKPDNVLLSERHALVTDFGVAKAVSEATGRQKLTTEGVALGTPAYMSPEQASANSHIDHRADIYAVGVVAYELLTGRTPFLGTTPQMILSAHMTDTPEPVSKYRESVPPALAQVVMKCLEKKAADRWQSAEELLPQLEAMATPSGGVTPTAMTPVGAVWAQRRKTVLGAGAALAIAVAGWWVLVGRGGTVADQPSASIRIAVLPFENLSATQQDEYLSEGVTQDINTQLSKIDEFVVIAHGSAQRVGSAEMTHAEAATELGVDYLVAGSVARAADRIHITARLIDPETDGQLWADDYDQELSASNVFAIRREVAEQVAAALNVILSPGEQARLTAQPTENTEAYRLYLEGRFFWNQRTPEGLQRAVELFQQALQNDPDYALAYAGLADAYNMLADYSYLPPAETFPKAAQAARRALQIDTTLAEAYVSLAHVQWSFDYDWTEAQRTYERAITLNPNYATGHQWYAKALRDLGRSDEALTLVQRALELDPTSLIINRAMGRVLLVKRDYDAAIQQLLKTLEMDPRFIPARRTLGLAYLHKFMYEEAILELQRAADLSSHDPRDVALLGYAYGVSGQERRARDALDRLLSDKRYVEPISIAKVYVGLGDRDRAVEWLNGAYEERCSELTHLFAWPTYDAVRTDPRVQDLLRRMNFPSDAVSR